MRSFLLALLLLLPACLEYEIRVTTVVQPDGSIRRSVTFRARDEGKPADVWRAFRRPGEPYALEGDNEKGFVATATLQAGCNPSGLRILLGDDEPPEGEEKAEIPAAEGTVDLRAVDLLVGTLYRYEERVALGTDPLKFREELPRWLDTALRALVEALKEKFPDIDFGPVEARARAELLPEIQRAVVNLHHALTAMMLELGPIASAAEPETFTRSEFWPAVARELAAFGIEVPKDGKALKRAIDQIALERTSHALRARIVERLIAQLPEARRAEVRDALLAEEGLGEEFHTALLPGAEGELAPFLASGLGAYVAYRFFDSIDLRFRLEMPGKPLRTNGELSALPAVEWGLGKEALVPPVLYAYSFVPAKGVPQEGWKLGLLAEVENFLRDLTPAARAEVEVVVAGALAEGWKEDGISDEAKWACTAIRKALEDASAATPKSK